MATNTFRMQSIHSIWSIRTKEGIVERRNDLGSKVLIGIVSLLVVTILSITISVASKADTKANDNKISIASIETTQTYFKENLSEIKVDIKEIKRAVVK